MAEHCSICDTRRPSGGTKAMVVGGAGWIEFCPRCAGTQITNGETGAVITLAELYTRGVPARAEEPDSEYNDLDATSCACGDYNAFEEREVFADGPDY